MLKITTIEDRTQRRLTIEGKLVGPWVTELKNACDKAKVDLGGSELVLDIQHLTAISQEGENVLLELMRNGTKFRCQGVFTKQVLKQLSHRVNVTLRETNQ